ncbi:MAG: hypothetical protein HOP29_10485 [Phycisphaerales bacterium]|nr:hypothetical protein [Phycisphaerales bacterium]
MLHTAGKLLHSAGELPETVRLWAARSILELGTRLRDAGMHDDTGPDADACGHRDGNGRFVAGCRPGPGRPAGTADAVVTDTRAVRRAIVASWDRVNGPAILDRLANDNPLAYLRLVASILPREANAKGDAEAHHSGTATIHRIGEEVGSVCGNWRERLNYAALPLDGVRARPATIPLADLR